MASRAQRVVVSPAGRTLAGFFSADARILSVRFRAKWPTGEDLLPANVGVKIPAACCPELLRTATSLACFVRQQFPRAETDLMQAPATLADYLRLQTLFSGWLEAVMGGADR